MFRLRRFLKLTISSHGDILGEGDLRIRPAPPGVDHAAPTPGAATAAAATTVGVLPALGGLLLLLELLLALSQALVAVEVLLDLLEAEENLAVEEEEGEEREDAGGDAPHPVDVDDDVGAVEAEEGRLHLGVGARLAVLGEVLSGKRETKQGLSSLSS